MRKSLLAFFSGLCVLASLAMGGGQATSNFGYAFFPAAVAITGGTMSGVTITNSAISGNSGSFTTLAASSTVSGAGFSSYLASPPAIGGTAPAAINGTIVTGGSFTNSQSVVITTLAGAGTGGSFSAFICQTGFTCTPNSGYLLGTMGTAPATGDLAEISWTTAFNHKPVCTVNAYDNTSTTAVTTNIQDTGSTTTLAEYIYAVSALTASHQISLYYTCF